MEIPSNIPAAASPTAAQAQVNVQKKINQQQEKTADTILQATEDSAAKIEATGKQLIEIA